MIRSVVKPKFVWSTNTPMRPRSDLAPGDGVISEIVPWGYMRSNRVYVIAIPCVLHVKNNFTFTDFQHVKL